MDEKKQFLEKSYEIFERVTALQPGHVDAVVNQCTTLMDLHLMADTRKRSKELLNLALEKAKQTLQLQPDNDKVLGMLGLIYYNQVTTTDNTLEKRALLTKAMQSIAKAKSRQSNNYDYTNNLSIVNRALAETFATPEEKYPLIETALALLLQINQLFPDDPTILGNLAVVYIDLVDLNLDSRDKIEEYWNTARKLTERIKSEEYLYGNFFFIKCCLLKSIPQSISYLMAQECTIFYEERDKLFTFENNRQRRLNFLKHAEEISQIAAHSVLRNHNQHLDESGVEEEKVIDIKRAIELLDSGMGILISDQINNSEQQLLRLQMQGPSEYALAIRYRELTSLLQSAQDRRNIGSVYYATEALSDLDPNTGANENSISSEILKEKYRELNSLLSDIRQLEGFDKFLTYPKNSDSINSASDEMPLVYLFTTIECSYVLMIWKGNLFSTSFAINQSNWLSIINHFFKQSRDFHFACERSQVQNHQAKMYPVEDLSNEQKSAKTAEFIAAKESWNQSIQQLLKQLGTLMSPVVEKLQEWNSNQAILLPHGYLSLLPWQAAELENGCIVAEKVAFSFAPNAVTAAESLRRQKTWLTRQGLTKQGSKELLDHTAGPLEVLSLTNPQYLQHGSLTYSEIEANHLMQFHYSQQIRLTDKRGMDARFADETEGLRGVDLKTLENIDILHLSCHGGASLEDPANSRLCLADDSYVTLDTIIEKWPLHNMRLVMLSCCQGALRGGVQSEAFSLHVSMVYGGAVSAVGALWSVLDDETSRFTKLFYDELFSDTEPNPSKALARATAKASSESDISPSTWASFQCMGV